MAEVERGLPDSLRQMIEQQLQALPEDGPARARSGGCVAGVESSAAAVAAGLELTGVAADGGTVCEPWRGQGAVPAKKSGVEAWPDGTVAGSLPVPPRSA